MARPRKFNEHEVLEQAMAVFFRHGYDGASMTELASAMGLNAPSIYAAFGSKRGLFESVLNRYTEARNIHHAWALSAHSARQVAERILLLTGEQPINTKQAPGCLLIQAGLAVSAEHPEIPLELAQRRQEYEQSLQERFEQAKMAGDLSVHADASTLARFVMTIYNGLSVKASEGLTMSELQDIAHQAMSGWETHALPAPPHDPPATEPPYQSTPEERGRPREFNPSDALSAAMEVFWVKGYEGASLSHLTEAMGITRPSLYATFGNKESLFIKALDQYQRVNMAYGRAALSAPTTYAVVEQLLEGAVDAQVSGEQPRGCLSVINAMQGGDQARRIRNEVLRRAACVHTLIVARLERAKIEGDLPAEADPEGLARLLASVLQSIATLGSAGASEEQLRALARSTISLWPTVEKYRSV